MKSEGGILFVFSTNWSQKEEYSRNWKKHKKTQNLKARMLLFIQKKIYKLI